MVERRRSTPERPEADFLTETAGRVFAKLSGTERKELAWAQQKYNKT